MSSTYLDAIKSVEDAMHEFYCEINDFLPDRWVEYTLEGKERKLGADELVFANPWSIEDCWYVYQLISCVCSIVLSTCLYDHWAHEASDILQKYTLALESNSIPGCHRALKFALDEFNRLLRAMRAARHQISRV